MFGYVVADSDKLSESGKERYKQAYCGLCHQLQEEYGGTGRMTLTYDMTFLSILLSSLYGSGESSGSRRCPKHPMTSHKYWRTECTRYAADMNIFMVYYKNVDDWNDDQSFTAKALASRLERFIPKIEKDWPRQCAVVKRCLRELSEMERRNELNPDLPTNCFGHLMGELFVMKEDEYSGALRRMGAAVGRFIYLLDACNDLKSDIKKQRYNPLVSQMDTDFTPILTMMIGESTSEFEKLELTADIDILRNVLYSGVWIKRRSKKEGENLNA